MCTVTYIPQDDGFIITSNRDEIMHRPTIAPKIYRENEAALLYPKDEEGGGTWIAANENGGCIVILNGAFENHQKRKQYRKSRGTILLEVIKSENMSDYFFDMNLYDIEPFTLITVQNNQLTELKWDEKIKHAIVHDSSKKHIWSSATLYNQEQRSLRQQWFEEFYETNIVLDQERILSFHQHTQTENTEFGLVIDRYEVLKTVSISQLIFKNNHIEMVYIDMVNKLPSKRISF